VKRKLLNNDFTTAVITTTKNTAHWQDYWATPIRFVLCSIYYLYSLYDWADYEYLL